MNKLLKYLADRELQSKVKESQDNADKKETATDNWVQKKSESFTAKFKEELACIIDAGIHFKFGMFYTDVLSVTFHYDYNGSTFQTAYISDDNWSPDWKSYHFSDYPNHYLLDVVGDWYKSLLPAPVKKDPVILVISFPENVFKGQAAQAFNVECPFHKHELTNLEMERFRHRILETYGLMEANCIADYDFDIRRH
jgi:hypothetical protein